MATYRISGVWKNSEDVITHYALHEVFENGTSRAQKTTKAQAVALVEHQGNNTTTFIWNYIRSRWTIGEEVNVVNGATGKFLRSYPDNKVSDNLAHLIDYDWIKA